MEMERMTRDIDVFRATLWLQIRREKQNTSEPRLCLMGRMVIDERAASGCLSRLQYDALFRTTLRAKSAKIT